MHPSRLGLSVLPGLAKKKKMKIKINNKMAVNTYLSKIESKKQTKQTRRTERESWMWRVF